MTETPPPEHVVRVRHRANRYRLSMRASRDGGFHLVEPYTDRAVVGTPDAGVPLHEIEHYLDELAERT
jgi:hypothetical protein